MLCEVERDATDALTCLVIVWLGETVPRDGDSPPERTGDDGDAAREADGERGGGLGESTEPLR